MREEVYTTASIHVSAEMYRNKFTVGPDSQKTLDNHCYELSMEYS